jgi:HlyD family secretion protein
MKKHLSKLRNKWVMGGGAIVILGVIGLIVYFTKDPAYQFVTVNKGHISESVSLTGNTSPAKSVSLSFGGSGIIARTYSDLGRKVRAGQVLAELNVNDLVAQLHQAQANVASQQARLEGMLSGARPADLALVQTNLDNAKIDLQNTKAQQTILVENAYRALLNSGLTAYATTNGASTVDMPTISGTYTGDEKGTYTITVYDTTAAGANFSLTGLETAIGQSVSTVPVPLGTRGLYIQFPSSYITSRQNTVWTVSIPNTKSASYSTNLNLYNSALATQSTVIGQKEAAIAQLEAQLNVAKAGSAPTDISAQEAQVAQARASVESAAAKLQNARIVAPISGTVTQFDAKVGQLGSAGTPLVSIMSDTGYEVDAAVSETDLGKISVGDAVLMTLDAFPGETFDGSVFYIAPSQTETQGVISYEIKISFEKADPRLKSGLTTNIDIQTNSKDDVLILPQYAILQNDEGTFVEVLEEGERKQVPVRLGLQDQDGNVEIISGVKEGQQVLNVGLKSK